MNAIELLKRQHEETDRLFREYARLSPGAHAHKRRLFARIADELAAHAQIEEMYFYPAANSAETEELLLESAEEHLAVKRIVADLLDLPVTDETFDPKMKVLHDLVQHHVGEEEQKLLPKVARAVEADALEDLGVQMEAEYGRLREGEPRANVPAQTDYPAPIH